MAKTRTNKLAALREKNPGALSPDELEILFRECERKIALFAAFESSEEWKLTRTRLEARKERLQHEREGMIRRLTRPLEGKPPVTTDQLAYQQGRIDENSELLTFPKTALALWRNELEGLQRLRERPA